MEPYFFGPSGALFGIFHAPSGSLIKPSVLIVPPLFADYMRTHRALRQIALQLNGRGSPVLRFDFSGTGDSFGDLKDLSREDWVANVVAAAEELRQLSGSDEVCVVTARYSALLVAEASQRTPFQKVVIWDPESSGDDLLKELYRDRGDLELDDKDRLQVAGFKVSRSFLDSWKGAALHELRCREQVHIVTATHMTPENCASTHNVDIDCTWKEGHNDEILYAHQVVDAICNIL